MLTSLECQREFMVVHCKCFCLFGFVCLFVCFVLVCSGSGPGFDFVFCLLD